MSLLSAFQPQHVFLSNAGGRITHCSLSLRLCPSGACPWQEYARMTSSRYVKTDEIIASVTCEELAYQSWRQIRYRRVERPTRHTSSATILRVRWPNQ